MRKSHRLVQQLAERLAENFQGYLLDMRTKEPSAYIDGLIDGFSLATAALLMDKAKGTLTARQSREMIAEALASTEERIGEGVTPEVLEKMRIVHGSSKH